MTEQELLARTQKMMRLFRLEEGFGLGRDWVIVASATDHLAPYPFERYKTLRDHLRSQWPESVQEVIEPRIPPKFTWHLCLRVGSPAVETFLREGFGVA